MVWKLLKHSVDNKVLSAFVRHGQRDFGETSPKPKGVGGQEIMRLTC